MTEAIKGKWLGKIKAPGDVKTLFDGQGVVGVHAVLLHTGKVLLWNGRYEGNDLLFAAWTWDPETGDESPALPFEGGPNGDVTKLAWTNDKDVDLFCSHHVALEDGRILVMGGGGGFDELNRFLPGHSGIFIFDPTVGTHGEWTKHGNMNYNRWYPTPVIMQDGSVLIFSGRGYNPPGSSTIAVAGHEILSPPNYKPLSLTGDSTKMNIYPGLHLVKGGHIFYTGTTWRYISGYAQVDLPTISFELDSNNTIKRNSYLDASGTTLKPAQPWREEGTSVLLPPAQDGRILLIGGGYFDSTTRQQKRDANPKSWEILDTQDQEGPKWIRSGEMKKSRINVNVVLLPDGKVLIVGGHNNHEHFHEKDGQALTAELFDPNIALNDPEQDPIIETEVMSASRMYHSTALLLPDGSVLTAGGYDPYLQSAPGTPAPQDHKNLEIYQPPYFFKGDRPRIDSISAKKVRYGEQFKITSQQASDITTVVLLRPGCVTHHTDPNQRYVSLEIVGNEKRTLSVIMENDATVAPPGYYMLFIVDNQSLPCEKAVFVHLHH